MRGHPQAWRPRPEGESQQAHTCLPSRRVGPEEDLKIGEDAEQVEEEIYNYIPSVVVVVVRPDNGTSM